MCVIFAMIVLTMLLNAYKCEKSKKVACYQKNKKYIYANIVGFKLQKFLVRKGVNKMPDKSFTEILSMVASACNREFYSGTKEIKEVVLECATQIYIAQMQRSDQNAQEPNR